MKKEALKERTAKGRKRTRIIPKPAARSRTADPLEKTGESLAHLASFPALNPNPVMEINLEGKVLYLNAAAKKLFPGIERTGFRHPVLAEVKPFVIGLKKSRKKPKLHEVKYGDSWYEGELLSVMGGARIRIYIRDVTARKKAEEELQRGRDLMEVVTKGTGVIIAAVDTGFRYTLFNRAYEEEVKRLSGKKIRIGSSMIETFSELPEQRRALIEEWTPVLRGKTTKKIIAFGDPSRRRRNYEVLHTPIRDARGRVIGAGEVALDVTDQVKIARSLQESEARFRLVLKNAPVSVAAQDRDLRFLWAYNQRTVKSSEIIGKTDGDIFPAEFAERLTALKRRVLESGSEIREQIWLESGGRRVFLDLFLEPLRDDDGQIIGVGNATVDLTPMKTAEDALETRVAERTAELRQQAELLDLANDAIIVRAIDGTVTFWNKGAEDLYGWTREAALGKNKVDLMRPQSPPSIEEINTGILAEGHWEGELNHLAENGRPILVFSRQVLKGREAGRPLEVLEINQDITERRRGEEQLRQLEKIKALGTLAGGIAHDINNILVPILINTELALSDAPKDSPMARRLAVALEATNRGKELVRQIIAFSRQEKQNIEPADLSAVLRDALKLLRSSISKNIVMSERIEGASCIVRVDPVQIHQVILNLGANAAHAMRENGGRLDIRLERIEVDSRLAAGNPDLKPGPYCRLTVSDTGHGMSSEVMSRAFDPFFTTKKSGEGTGMGLSVVHGIIKAHGGSITVYSEPGQGTTFYIYLPRIQEGLNRKTTGDDFIATGTERVLFIDDEKIVIQSIRPMLEKLGYKVTGTTSPREAMALFRQDPQVFDLVITDQSMPDMSGETLAREMMSVRPDIPIILSTGFSETLREEEVKAQGVREIIMKPYSIKDISACIRRALAGSRER
jgi:two-component system, cell cycle sensor histidine kinase and response regulator CckA